MRIIAFLFSLIFLVPTSVSAAFPRESESESSNTQVIKEVESEDCAGFGVVTCLISAVFDFLAKDSLSLSDSPLATLFSIQKSALSGTDASNFDGSITSLLPPNYQQDGRDPRTALIQTESQSISGEILLNRPGNGAADVSGGGTYAVESGAKRIPATFDEIAPILNKFGFLRQALSPETLAGNFKFSLPNVNFGPRNEPGKINLDENKEWDVQWNAGERSKTISGSPDSNDPDCSSYSGPPAQGDGTCTYNGSGELAVSAPLLTATKVESAQQAGENLLAVAQLFLPPGSSFKPGDIAEGVAYEVKYKNETSQAKIPLKGLGGAVDAYRCVTEQFFLPPGGGGTGPCEKVISFPTALEAETGQTIQGYEVSESEERAVSFWTNLGTAIGKFLGSILSL